MTGSRMRCGGAALALLLAGYGGLQWYRGAAAPSLTIHPAVEPETAAAISPSSTLPTPARDAEAAVPSPPTGPTAASPAPVQTGALMVHVVGGVRKPGVYRLASKARLTDALRAAGGPRAGADLEAVNLASFVQDGEQIRIPMLAERRTPRASAAPPIRAVLRTATPPRSLRTTARYPLAVRPVSSSSPPDRANTATVSSNGLVNINTASVEELDTLPGVGPSTAAAIIQFRSEHGPFQRVEDLLEVRGIGDKKLAGMRDRIVLQ